MFGISLVHAGNPYWIEPRGDMATMMAGFNALMDDRWRFPLTVTERLRDFPVATIYSDSLPWVAVVFKATGLDKALNPLGAFLLLSYALQPLGMVVLLRACGVRRASTLAAGALIALCTPAWLVRQFGHIALGGHFVLLFALALSVGSIRHGLTRWRTVGFAGLAALATGIHAYHLVPIFACLGAAALSEMLQRQPGGFARAALATLAALGSTGICAWVLGYGVGQGFTGGGGAMGVWSMNMVGPLLPQASALFGQNWNGGWFNHTLDPNGAQAFEGFAYVGAGVILLAASGVLLLALDRRVKAELSMQWMRRFGPLILAMVFLLLWAVGPRGYLGPWLMFDLGRLQGWPGEVIGVFRAHGRFSWTVGYAIAAFGLTAVDRLGGRARLALLLAATALQAVEVTQLLRGVRSVYEHQYMTYYTEAELFRTSPIFEARDWRFYPLMECATGYNTLASVQLQALALRRGGTTNSGATARGQTVRCEPPPAEMLVAAAPEDRRITVVLDEPGVIDRFRQRNDCRTFSRGLICGRGLAATGLPPARRTAWETRIETRFDTGQRPQILGRGWSLPEGGGIWTDGKSASLIFPAKSAPGGESFTLEVEATGYSPDAQTPQIVIVSLDGQELTRWSVLAGVYRVDVPARAPGKTTELLFQFPNAASPNTLNPNARDPRLLAIAVRRVTLLR